MVLFILCYSIIYGLLNFLVHDIYLILFILKYLKMPRQAPVIIATTNVLIRD